VSGSSEPLTLCFDEGGICGDGGAVGVDAGDAAALAR
jgi:hypothetical protein